MLDQLIILRFHQVTSKINLDINFDELSQIVDSKPKFYTTAKEVRSPKR